MDGRATLHRSFAQLNMNGQNPTYCDRRWQTSPSMRFTGDSDIRPRRETLRRLLEALRTAESSPGDQSGEGTNWPARGAPAHLLFQPLVRTFARASSVHSSRSICGQILEHCLRRDQRRIQLQLGGCGVAARLENTEARFLLSRRSRTRFADELRPLVGGRASARSAARRISAADRLSDAEAPPAALDRIAPKTRSTARCAECGSSAIHRLRFLVAPLPERTENGSGPAFELMAAVIRQS
jgi:hypothetical protein